jgi:hypothetical protein
MLLLSELLKEVNHKFIILLPVEVQLIHISQEASSFTQP